MCAFQWVVSGSSQQHLCGTSSGAGGSPVGFECFVFWCVVHWQLSATTHLWHIKRCRWSLHVLFLVGVIAKFSAQRHLYGICQAVDPRWVLRLFPCECPVVSGQNICVATPGGGVLSSWLQTTMTDARESAWDHVLYHNPTLTLNQSCKPALLCGAFFRPRAYPPRERQEGHDLGVWREGSHGNGRSPRNSTR
eukprot:scaffold52594_cov19-Tisochrysis_lutea.AAC.3